MGYDVTNNSSILELGNSMPVEQAPLTSIMLPDVTPAPPELIKQSPPIRTKGTITISAAGGVPPYTYSIDGVNYQSSNVFTNIYKDDITVYIKDSVGTIVTIEGIDASPYINYVEGVTAIPIPTSLPADPIVLIDMMNPAGGSIEIPDVLPTDGVVLLETIPLPNQSLFTQITKLIDLDDVSTLRNDGDLLVYNASTDKYVHTPLSSLSTDAHYTHSQSIAAQVWDIYHNLGKYPAIQVANVSGTMMFPEIRHIDFNHAQAVFGNSTFSGVAYCN